MKQPVDGWLIEVTAWIILAALILLVVSSTLIPRHTTPTTTQTP